MPPAIVTPSNWCMGSKYPRPDASAAIVDDKPSNGLNCQSFDCHRRRSASLGELHTSNLKEDTAGNAPRWAPFVESGCGAPALRSPAAAKPAGRGDGGVIPTPSITSHSRLFPTELFLWKRCPRVVNGSGGQIIQHPSPPVLPMRLGSPLVRCLLSSLVISIVNCRPYKRLRHFMRYSLNVKENN